MSDAGVRASRQVDLAQVSMPRLLFALLHQRFSGTIALEQPNDVTWRTIWFRGGMPVFTDWAVPTEVLGQVLIHHGMIDEGQLLRTLETMAAQGGLLGRHLLEQGTLDRPQLLEGLRHQCRRKLTHMFELRSGIARVTVGNPEGDPELLAVNVLGLILAGVSHAYDEARARSEMGADLEAPVRSTGALHRYRSHFRFRPGDQPALEALATGSHLATLAALPGGSRRRASQLVYTLWACQMLRTGSAASLPSGAQPTVTPGTRSTTGAAPAAATAAPSRPRVATPAPAAPARTSAPNAARRRPSPSASPPKTPDDPSTGDDDDPFLAELEVLEAKVAQKAHAFALFDVALTATKKDIRRAWGDLSRKFHPDALKGAKREALRERVNHVFAALSEAQQLLNDADERAKLRESIEKGEHDANQGGRDATATAHAVFQSELLAKEADKLLRANHFERALARYQEAARYNADELDLQAAIAWCEYRVSEKTAQDLALVHARLSGVIEQAPNIARAHYFLGFVHVDEGTVAAAIETFRKAAQLDARLIDAERQARALEMRSSRPSPSAPATRGKSKSKSKPKSKFSGLRGLFGGKKS